MRVDWFLWCQTQFRRRLYQRRDWSAMNNFFSPLKLDGFGNDTDFYPVRKLFTHAAESNGDKYVFVWRLYLQTTRQRSPTRTAANGINSNWWEWSAHWYYCGALCARRDPLIGSVRRNAAAQGRHLTYLASEWGNAMTNKYSRVIRLL